jgi:type II secretory pathway pseudopilin PulG
MNDPFVVLAVVCISAAVWLMGFQAGMNKAKREERERQRFLRAFLKGQR